MPLLNHADTIRSLLAQVQSQNIAIPCFCAENTHTVEGILEGMTRVAEQTGLEQVPVYIAVTANYHGRQQLRNYTSLDNIEEGFLAFRGDMERLCRQDGPYPRVWAIPNLDHGQPDSDLHLIEQGRDFWGCVMYDCSTRPMDTNRRMTAAFVKQWRDDFVIEGCVDEIVESGEDADLNLTQPEQAKQFLDETQVDLMVVNLGTEHRATAAERRYHGDLAQQIRDTVGAKLVLHGTSSLNQGDLQNLRHDGITKVNIWTILETAGAARLAEDIICNAHRIMPPEALATLQEDGWLGDQSCVLAQQSPRDLHAMTELHRRNDVKVPVIAQLVEDYCRAFGYWNLRTDRLQ